MLVTFTAVIETANTENINMSNKLPVTSRIQIKSQGLVRVHV